MGLSSKHSLQSLCACGVHRLKGTTRMSLTALKAGSVNFIPLNRMKRAHRY
jgi:hypothetical protein